MDYLVRDDIGLAAVGGNIAEASDGIERALDSVPVAVGGAGGGEQEPRQPPRSAGLTR